MRCRTTTTARRAGLTLIELLVVMAIIGVLASLTISAVFTLRESQIKSAAENTIQKLASALDQQYKAVLDECRADTVPGWAVTMANGDLRRARVIYTKGRIAQEFPTTFAKALAPNNGVTTVNLPPKPTYVKACSGVTLPANTAWESSALLYLALSQGRRGMAAASSLDDSIEPNAIQTVTASGKDFRILVDSYGNPLAFFNFPTGNVELNAPPYVNNDTTNFPSNGRDPVDPEGTLYGQAWPAVLRGQFQTAFHTLNPPDAGIVPGTANGLLPVIASAGRDGQLGLNPTTMATTNADQAGDNIYSYRLRRSGAKGD